MTARTEAVDAVLAAVRRVPGVRPAAPVTGTWVPFEAETFAVAVEDDRVTVELVVLAFPVEPSFAAATAGIRAALRGTAWAGAEIRLVASDVDRSAFGAPRLGEVDHTIGA